MKKRYLASCQIPLELTDVAAKLAKKFLPKSGVVPNACFLKFALFPFQR